MRLSLINRHVATKNGASEISGVFPDFLDNWITYNVRQALLYSAESSRSELLHPRFTPDPVNPKPKLFHSSWKPFSKRCMYTFHEELRTEGRPLLTEWKYAEVIAPPIHPPLVKADESAGQRCGSGGSDN